MALVYIEKHDQDGEQRKSGKAECHNCGTATISTGRSCRLIKKPSHRAVLASCPASVKGKSQKMRLILGSFQEMYKNGMDKSRWRFVRCCDDEESKIAHHAQQQERNRSLSFLCQRLDISLRARNLRSRGTCLISL